MFEFKITGKLTGEGRAGVLSTPHGDIHTPVFMPVGTNATVKSVPKELLESTKPQVILANNYHLYLRGRQSILSAGGIHRFMNWQKPVLTDSGGFQVFSLSHKAGLAKITDEGVAFTSHIDGSKHFFTPELAIQSQIDIGADIIMAFDECTQDSSTHTQATASLSRTHTWLDRCITYHKAKTAQTQALFGIIQGGQHKDLRLSSAAFVIDKNLPGIAIGGETIGYNMDKTEEVMSWLTPFLPQNKPRYTMGLGLRPSDLIRAIEAGSDMFDCVAPTRLARNGALYTGKVVLSNNHLNFQSQSKTERLSIGRSAYAQDHTPIDPDCDCHTCANYTKAYLHHLYKCDELLYHTLASVHNIRMMIKTVEDAIALGSQH